MITETQQFLQYLKDPVLFNVNAACDDFMYGQKNSVIVKELTIHRDTDNRNIFVIKLAFESATKLVLAQKPFLKAMVKNLPDVQIITRSGINQSDEDMLVRTFMILHT